MPPNLGGFFMVRSYYPSECHADYFDFERIEALKPAIEACGISTLSQSPMLGFHKQMDNRIKLLEEILSFRMQGVGFDNGDMYVDGHKAASDVRDEFVSVTEKLMDELAQCYNVLPQLDINNTIDHRPEGDEKWFLENEKTVTQFCRKLAAERPLKDIRDEYNYPKKKGIKDECSRLLEASTMKSRRGFAIQRLMNAMRQAHADGWFIVFDTLTAISIFVCLSMVQLIAVFISMRCTLCGHFLQVALTLILVVGYAIAASSIACKIRGLMVTVCPSQFATRRTLFHVRVGCGLLLLKVSRLKLPVIWLLVSMWLNTLTKSQIWTLLLKV